MLKRLSSVQLPVTRLVVIPWDKLHEGVIQRDASLGIKDARPIHLDTMPLASQQEALQKAYQELWIQIQQYLLSPMKSVETTSSSVYPKIPFILPSDSALEQRRLKSQGPGIGK